MPAGLRPETPSPSVHVARRRVLEVVCAAVIAREAELNALDAKVGDGDTGTTFATAARAVLAELDRLPFADAGALCAAIAGQLSSVMGGSSGILLSIGVSAMGVAARASQAWPAALRAGVRRIQQVGGAGAGDRTLLDALLPAIAALEAEEGLAGAAAAAQRGAEATRTMTRTHAGRASYVPESALRGVPDPGAVAIAAIFAALAAASPA
nr:DAK2 domain-containing protein [Nannocystis pusilla]